MEIESGWDNQIRIRATMGGTSSGDNDKDDTGEKRKIKRPNFRVRN